MKPKLSFNAHTYPYCTSTSMKPKLSFNAHTYPYCTSTSFFTMMLTSRAKYALLDLRVTKVNSTTSLYSAVPLKLQSRPLYNTSHSTPLMTARMQPNSRSLFNLLGLLTVLDGASLSMIPCMRCLETTSKQTVPLGKKRILVAC